MFVFKSRLTGNISIHDLPALKARNTPPRRIRSYSGKRLSLPETEILQAAHFTQ